MKSKNISAIVIVLILLFGGLMVGIGNTHISPYNISNIANGKSSADSKILSGMHKTPYVNIPYAPGSISRNLSNAYNGQMSVMVTFKLSHQSQLNSFLSNLSNPSSSQYHKYLNRSEFTSMFSPSQSIYSNAVNYFYSFQSTKITTFQDRVSLVINAPGSVIDKMFNTRIETSLNNSSAYFASSVPQLPSPIGNYVSQVSGLSNHKLKLSYNMGEKAVSSSRSIITNQKGYPTPIESSGVQYIYGSDLQVAYDEQSLLNITYPTHEVIATILWSGQNSSGTPVGSFYPADIYAYYNATLPSYEPHPRVYGVPINGAPKPGISSTYDTTGASFENTLDLEMVGSTAPGASIYNVYGPNATFASLNAAFAYVLNPNSSFSQLNNVSVISNSWGGSDFNDTAWYTYLQEAQARGITVLASSGDSGNNIHSSKYFGGPDSLWFPASMAYNNFGMTAVGGTTTTLTPSFHLENQSVWYISANDSADGGPAGSTGGISSVFPEPSWQKNTEANRVIQGRGRGVPDIAAIANNTIVYETANGTSYYGNPYFYLDWGTSIASPLVAGIIAEMDAVLNHYKQQNLGYLNPMIYHIANEQISPFTSTSTTGYFQTGGYNSTLPLTAFNDVKYGRNHVYNASFGYDLVTGWGSIDAYNLTMYLLSVNYSGKNFALRGVENTLNLSALKVTSYFYNTTTKGYTTVNNYYNASIQQNMFVADALGAPIYWIQNVIYINGSSQTGWAMNYSGWVVYPFYGLYPSETVYQYNYPLGKIITLPHQFNIKTWLSNINSSDGQTMNFEVNSQILQIPVPGASFIISSHNYTYFWQGKKYYNGPYPNNPYLGGLDPQFGLVGGPSLGRGEFLSPTAGNLSAYIQPLGTNSYIPAATAVYNNSVDETGETSENLQWIKTNSGLWDLSIQSGNFSQGVLSYYPQTYKTTFTESGLTSGTAWYVNLSNGQSFSGTGTSISFSEPNGTYSYSIASVNKSLFSSGGSFTVNGNPISQSVTFSGAAYQVTFTETGLPSGTMWYVNLSNGQTFSGSKNTISFSEPNGTYSYTIASVNKSLFSSGGSFTVNGNPTSQPITFSKGYKVTFTESGLPTGSTWYVNIAGQVSSGAIYGVSYSIYLSNGSYTYTVQTPNKIYEPSYINSFTVNGKALPETITFSKVTYKVIFNETALPSGTMWYVNLSNGQTFSGTGTSITFSEPNGTYSYTIATINKSLSSSGGSFTVNGNPTSQPITFSEVTYKVTFTETGLSSGTMWYVNLSNGQTFSGSKNTISFSEPNGTYSYTIATINKSWSSSGSSFTVNGNPVSQPITFSEVTYKVTFTESGLPTGSTWYVNITGQASSGAITGTSYSIYLSNGSYSYTTQTPNKIYEPSYTNSFKVNGNPVSQTVTFSMVYKITFTESGLPSGTVWYVNLSDGQSFSGTGTTITLSEPNGTYSYSIATVNKSWSSSGGSFTVKAGTMSQTVTFSEVTYKVTFTEIGLSSGTTWYVNLTNGQSFSGTGTSISFSEPNGTYSYTISTTNKQYKASPSNGSFAVAGSFKSISITFSSTNASSLFTLYNIIGVVIAVIIIASVSIILIKRRRG